MSALPHPATPLTQTRKLILYRLEKLRCLFDDGDTEEVPQQEIQRLGLPEAVSLLLPPPQPPPPQQQPPAVPAVQPSAALLQQGGSQAAAYAAPQMQQGPLPYMFPQYWHDLTAAGMRPAAAAAAAAAAGLPAGLLPGGSAAFPCPPQLVATLAQAGQHQAPAPAAAPAAVAVPATVPAAAASGEIAERQEETDYALRLVSEEVDGHASLLEVHTGQIRWVGGHPAGAAAAGSAAAVAAAAAAATAAAAADGEKAPLTFSVLPPPCLQGLAPAGVRPEHQWASRPLGTHASRRGHLPSS